MSDHLADLDRIMRIEELRTTHRDGVWWYQAPLPPRVHRCKAWTCEYDAGLHLYWFHCACGATSREGWIGLVTKRKWLHRNERRFRTPAAGSRTQ